MDSSTDVLAAKVRTKRHAVDDDLERLGARLKAVSSRRLASRWRSAVAPVAAGAAAVWLWRRSRSITSLRDLLVDRLSDLYRAERQLLPVLDRMRKAASNPDLASLLRRHAAESRAQIERLRRVLRSVGARPGRGKSSAIAGLDRADRRLLRRPADPRVRDAWLIAMAQRAEHVEIAAYGTARTFAETLGYTYAAHLLQQTLEEERAMDEQLTRLAERFVNLQSIR